MEPFWCVFRQSGVVTVAIKDASTQKSREFALRKLGRKVACLDCFKTGFTCPPSASPELPPPLPPLLPELPPPFPRPCPASPVVCSQHPGHTAVAGRSLGDVTVGRGADCGLRRDLVTLNGVGNLPKRISANRRSLIFRGHIGMPLKDATIV